jgi:hypothetical protein
MDEDKEEMVQIIVSRATKEQLAADKIARNATMNVMQAQKQVARANMLSAKALLDSGLSVEEAKKIVEKTSLDFNYAIGRKRAEELGNPKDIDTYFEEYVGKMMQNIPWVDPCQVIERTEKRAVWGVNKCLYAEFIHEMKREFPDTLTDEVYDVIKSRCMHDEGWSLGFIPEMKYKRVQFILDGDPGCFFDVEVP